MAYKTINDRKLLSLIDKDGLTQAEAARKLGVTRQAVSQRLKELRPANAFAVAGTVIRKAVGKKLDIMEQLCLINARTYKILDNVEDDPALAIRAVGEIRAQLKLQADLFSLLFDMNSAAQFQEAILETLNEVDPELRKQAIAKLNEKNAMNNLIRFK